jgi:hypothetical protein
MQKLGSLEVERIGKSETRGRKSERQKIRSWEIEKRPYKKNKITIHKD